MYITSSSLAGLGIASDDMVMVTPPGAKFPKYIVKMTGTSKATATLQKDEMAIMKTPSRFSIDNEEATLVQGPSLIGVHANKTEDKDVVLFSD